MTHSTHFQARPYGAQSEPAFWPEAGPAIPPPAQHTPTRGRKWTAKSITFTSLFLLLFASVTSFSTILVMQSQAPQRFEDYFSNRPAVHQPAWSQPTRAQVQPKTRHTPPRQPSDTTPQTLLGETLHQLSLANFTNTYSQFHHVAAPAFQRVNSAQKLRDIFSWMRQRQVTLSTGATLHRVRVHSAAVDQKGFLNISGVIAARPQPLKVKAAYQKSQGAWKLFGIHVALQPAMKSQ